MLFRSSEIEDGGAFPHDKYDHSALFSDEIQDGDACDDEDDLEQASLLSRNSETTTTNSSSSSLSSSPAVEAAAVLSSSFSSLCSSVSSSFCFRADGVQNTGKGMVWRMCGEGGSGPVMALLSLVLLCAMVRI